MKKIGKKFLLTYVYIKSKIGLKSAGSLVRLDNFDVEIKEEIAS